MICTRYIFCYTQLVSIIDPSTDAPKGLHSLIDSGGPRPRALGDNHATDAVPRVRLGDGCARESGQFEERDVRGLIPRTNLEYINVSDSGSRVGAI
jgi:hypothetical protein